MNMVTYVNRILLGVCLGVVHPLKHPNKPYRPQRGIVPSSIYTFERHIKRTMRRECYRTGGGLRIVGGDLVGGIVELHVA
jgi:hypothetical protein